MVSETAWIRQYFDELPDLVVVVDMSTGHIIEANTQGCANVGYAVADVLDVPIQDFVHPDDVVLFGDVLRGLRTGRSRLEQRWKTKDGQWRLYDLYLRMLDDSRLLVRGHDLTPLAESERRIESLTHLLELTEDLLVVSDSKNRVVWANEAASRLHGEPDGGWSGARLLDYVLDDESREAFFGLGAAMTNENHRASARIKSLRQDGSLVELWITTAYDPDTELWFSIERDITSTVAAERESERLTDELGRLALTDSLTGLANRRALIERIDAVIDERASASLMMLDLDRFKLLNDSLGHSFGDALLDQISSRLRSCAVPAAMVARLGGDEFGVLFRGPYGEGELIEFARRIYDDLVEPYELFGRRIDSTVSIGIASAAPSETTSHLLRNADLAMYRAKRTGRNRIAVFDDQLREEIDERVAVETALREALADDRIQAAGQCIFDARSGSLAGVELLARWDHPTLRSVDPAVFVPIAEEAGLLDTITFSLVDQLHAAFPGSEMLPRATINVAASQLAAVDFAPRLVDQVKRAGGHCEDLVIEVSESGLAGAVRDAAATISELISAGFQLMIDDFGKGVSALSYLRDLPLVGVKIDGSFVQSIDTDPFAATIASSVIDLARQLELTSVAECIETPQQQRMLTDMGCDWLQGYLLHHPEPLTELTVTGPNP